MTMKTPDPRPNITVDFDEDEARVVMRILQEAKQKPNAMNRGLVSKAVDKIFDKLYPTSGKRRRR